MKPARERKGRYFPISPSEVVARLKGPALPGTEERLSTVMANPIRHLTDKILLAELRPRRLTVFSLPDVIAHELGTRLMHEALALIGEAGPPKAAGLSGGVARTFVVYYEPQPGKAVSLYERRIHVQRRKARSAEKFSRAFKPRITKTEERRLASRPVTGES